MTPADESILKTVNLLVMLHRSSINNPKNKTDEDKNNLLVKKEYVTDAGLNVPDFLNNLQELSDKGYLESVAIYDSSFKKEINSFIGSEDEEKFLKFLEDNPDKDQKIVEETKKAFAKGFKDKLPSDFGFDEIGFMEEEMSVSDMLKSGLDRVKSFDDDTLATIIIFPFRNLKRLLRLLNEGKKLSEVKDPGLWYDPENFQFHIDEKTIPTSYNNKPNKEHFVLKKMFEGLPEETEVNYDEVESFDKEKDIKIENRSFYERLMDFNKKHSNLKNIFTPHSSYLEFNKDYLDHTH